MYLSSLQLAIAKGQTALQLWFERYDVSKAVTPIRTLASTYIDRTNNNKKIMNKTVVKHRSMRTVTNQKSVLFPFSGFIFPSFSRLKKGISMN